MNKQLNDLVSVIIPVYNTNKYLKRCINSILNQTYKNLQIILINDGSTDDSGKICNAFADNDSRIEVIHQSNKGLSAARNIGLDHMNGQWVTFLDSDDYVSMYYIEQTLNACINHSADITVCKHYSYSGEVINDKFTNTVNFEIIDKDEAIIRHFGKKSHLLIMACCKLYRASLWKDLRFPLGKIMEDVFVSHNLMYKTNKVVMLDAYLYAWLIHPASITQKQFSLSRLDALDAWQEGVRFYEQVGKLDYLAIAMRVYCNRLFDAYGISKKLLPNEIETHKQIRLESINVYKKIRYVYSYVDLSLAIFVLYRGKQIIGRYWPALYSFLFLRKRTLI